MNSSLSVSSPYDSYPNLDQCCKDDCDSICKGKTAQEICDMGNYLCDKGQQMKNDLAKSVKVEDFVKMKNKGIVDDESAEGEE